MTLRRRSILHHIAYPVLLLVMAVVLATTLHYQLDPGLASFFFLIGTITYLAVLERLIPYERSWHPSRREWGWYGVYFVLTVLGGGLAQLFVMVAVGALSPPDPALALWVEIPCALLLGSLASYTMHRLGHTNRWLWRLHGVHHVPAKVNVANNGVNHILDIALAQSVVQLALAVAGFSQESVFAVALFVIVQGHFIHANIDVRIGWLNRLVVSPEQHRLHHSTDLSEAGHYSADLSIWDQAFGTFTWHPGRKPDAVGLDDPTSFPETGAVVATLMHPWRRQRNVDQLSA